MLNYKQTKKDYFYLKELYGGHQYPYEMDQRRVNYYIFFTVSGNTEKTGEWQIRIGNPNIPKSSCGDINVENKNCDYLQKLLNSIKITKSGGIKKYLSGLVYDIHEGVVTHPLEYSFTVKREQKNNTNRSKRNYATHSVMCVDYALIYKYIRYIKSLPQRIMINSPDMDHSLLSDNDQWALLSHSAYFIDDNSILCDEHKYNFKYFIPIFNDAIITIFDFTDVHIDLLRRIKSSVTEWIASERWKSCGYNEEKISEMKAKIRFYTLFPNQNYLYPFFIVDYYDETNISYTRIVDDTRMILLDDIIEILEKNKNMKKYFVKYYTPRDSSLFIFAQKEIKNTLQLFFHICGDMLIQSGDMLTQTGDMTSNSFAVLAAEDEFVDNGDILKKTEDVIKQKLQEYFEGYDPNQNILDEKEITDEIIDNIYTGENYKILYFFWKHILGNENFYSGLLYAHILLKEPTKQKQQKTRKRTGKNKGVRNRSVLKKREDLKELKVREKQEELKELKGREDLKVREEQEDLKDLTNYTVVMVFFDGTRGTSPFRTIVGLVCRKGNVFYQINILTDKLFKQDKIANNTEFPLIGKIINKLVNGIGDVVLRKGIDNHYYGKGINDGEIPCIIEIHELPGNLDFIYDNIRDNMKYQDYIYAYKVFKKGITKENDKIISANLSEFINIKLDSEKMPLLLALILYRYHNDGSLQDNTLKKNIRRNLLHNIPEYYIFSHPEYPFIVIPDLSLLKTYATSSDKFKLQINNFDMIIWHADKNIYDNAIDIVYKDGKTINRMINELTENSEYPFTEGKIDKFLINPDDGTINEFPHTFRYTSINLLDKLYIFLNHYYEYVYKHHKLDLNNFVIEKYFHNTYPENSILHLHVRAKDKKVKLRHIYGGIINDIEYAIAFNLDDVWRNLKVHGEDYYKNKYLAYIYM